MGRGNNNHRVNYQWILGQISVVLQKKHYYVTIEVEVARKAIAARGEVCEKVNYFSDEWFAVSKRKSKISMLLSNYELKQSAILSSLGLKK